MKKYLLILLLLAFCSCSSEEAKPHFNAKRLSFNIYDQDLETILEVVSERYDLDLDFDVSANEVKHSLSVLNSSVNDVLKKLSSSTGYYMKVVDGEILVEEEIFDESMIEINLKFNKNLWEDIHSGAKAATVNEETIKYFFGPLFKNVDVTDIDESSRIIELYLPKEDVPFIKKSLLYLNYLDHKRNSALSVYLVQKKNLKKFTKSLNSKEAVFAWKLNAGDNINYKDDSGATIELNSQLLSEENNFSNTEAFVKLKYNDELVEQKFNFLKNDVQVVNFNDKLSMVVKSDWYIDGNKVSHNDLSSRSISSYLKPHSTRTESLLKSKKKVETGKQTLNDIASILESEKFNCRVVSLTSNQNSDIEKYSIDFEKETYSLEDILNKISSQINSSYIIDEFGVLIDCQGSLSDSQNISWKILPKPLDGSFYRFSRGAYFVTKEGFVGPVLYLPSANALIGLANSKILED